MAKLQLKIASTNFRDRVFIIDAASTINGGKTGLTATSGQLATPTSAANATATTGGTLVPGTYFYRVSGTTASGETLACAEYSQVVPAGTNTNTVTVNWAQLAGATGYKVYGRTTGAEQLLATITLGTTTTFVDTGAVTPSGALPSVNTTGLQLLFIRKDQNTVTRVQPTVGVIGTWSSGGFVEIDPVALPGLYEIGIPNNALASSDSTIVSIWGYPGVAAQEIGEYQLGVDPTNSVNFGLSALPAAAPNANGGIATIGETGQLLDANDIAAIWSALTSGMSTAGSIGLLLKTALASLSAPGTNGGLAILGESLQLLDTNDLTAIATKLLANPGKPFANNASDGSVLRDLTQLLPAPRDMSTVLDNATTAADAEWAALTEAYGQQDEPSPTTYRKKTSAGTVTRGFTTNPNNTAPTSRV